MDAPKIRFGTTARWELAADARIASFDDNQQTLADIDAAVDSALGHPIDFPSLDQAVVPGDQLVFVVDPCLPAMPQVVISVIQWFFLRGTQWGNMRIVLAAGNALAVQELEQAFSELGQEMKIELHDPDATGSVAYVAANEASDPIYLNRSVVDADVVVPIMCGRSRASLDYFGAFSLFPLLSNRTTRGKFYSLPKLDNAAEHEQLRAWADQAAWWVGIVFAIEVIPAGLKGVAAVLAGALEPLEAAAQQAMSQTWRTPEQVSDLTIALVDGAPSQQTWLAVARALRNAARCAAARGTLVICTQLQGAIGKGLQRLRNQQELPPTLAQKLASDDSDDAIAAAIMLQVTAHHHVYLVSDLRPETVESLGLGVINQAEQLSKLVQQHGSCVILGSAQHRASQVCHV